MSADRTLPKGVLSSNLVGINYVNAPIIAKQRGIEVKTSKSNDNKNAIEIRILSDLSETIVKGELIAKGIKRIVRLNSYATSIEPKKNMLLVPHTNKPNMVAQVATVIGQDNINIAGMQVAQDIDNSEKSIMIINVDSNVEKATLDKIAQIDGVDKALYIEI